MKRNILVGISLLVVAGGIWFGCAAWRAHKKLVTLNVRNVPIADVVHKMESQTWEKIVVDKRLAGNVTLQLKDTPLSDALDKLAEQIGAAAEAIHAVHHSSESLKRLQTALVNGTDISSVDFTNLAPSQISGLPEGVTEKMVNTPGAHHIMATKTFTMDASALSNMNLGELAGKGVHSGVQMMKMEPDGTMTKLDPGALPPEISQALASGNATVSVSDSGSEKIVAENALEKKLAGDLPKQPTRAEAEAAAHKVDAKCTTLYALEKSDMPMAAAMRKELTAAMANVLKSGSATNLPSPSDLQEQVAQVMQKARAGRFQNLTPEARAAAARAGATAH